ncbi:hypothetical protein GCM10010096_09350 [Alcaligenes pakistanensis]|uniref:Uncharacterized protein n=1 Tax=Alcaligenes pakistanensis TaxID=1482717 RepID=A0A8H9IN47_9BURK|nr:hypothetical protein [Alcaligenes pakistanensis]GHC40859.1 hypothetical protein GCM10010096_09350 [Alcaligenes pakistanensis]
MYDFDVVFLLIAQPASLRVGDMLGLHDYLAGSGMCTTVATSPTDLATIGKRLRIIVIDGEGDSDFDVYAVVAAMRQLDNVAIVLLADETPMARERGLYAGADICLPAWVANADFFRSVIELASGQPLTPSSDERVALKRKRPRRRHYLGLHPRSRYYR